LDQHGLDKNEAGLYAEVIKHGATVVALEAPDAKARDVLKIMEKHGAGNINRMIQEYRSKQPQQARSSDQTETLPVIEEQVTVGKHSVLRGGVRVTSTVSERPIQETVKLTEERVQVERHPVERQLSAKEADAAFQEKSIEMTERSEEASIHKQARVVEEVALKKTIEEREQNVQATARRTDVAVEQIPTQQRPAESKPQQQK
jgi:stress response protein YsnF